MGGKDAIAAQHMRLYIATSTTPPTSTKEKDVEVMSDKPEGPIPDTATLSEHDVKNDAVLYVTFAKEWNRGDDSPVSDEDDAWEDIEVAKS